MTVFCAFGLCVLFSYNPIDYSTIIWFAAAWEEEIVYRL